MQARSKAAPASGHRSARAARAAVLTAGLAAATPAAAQYTAPGSTTRTSTIPTEEEFDRNLQEARWRLGSVRLVPWLGVRDAAYVSSEGLGGDVEEDFTLTAGLGVRGYLPSGKLTWAAHVLPEYSWWQDDEDKRNLNGRLGLGLFGHFNRLRLQLSQRRVEQQAFFSDEIRELTSSRSDRSNLKLEIDLARRLMLYGSAARIAFENEEVENPALTALDRDEEIFELGLRYRSPRGLTLSLGWEESSTDFEPGARDLSNSGSSQLAALGFDGTRFDVSLALRRRDLSADEGSDFGEFDDTVGSLELAWDLTSRAALLTYARREQRYSVDAASSYNLFERQGARLEIDLGAAALGLIGEVGEDEYTSVATGGVGRVDDVTSYGVDLRTDFELVGVGVQYLLTEYDSTFDDFDREVAIVGFRFELGGLVERLRLGEAPGIW